MPAPQATPPVAEDDAAEPARSQPHRLRPERRTRADVVVGVVLAVAVLVTAIVLGATSDAADTTSVPAAVPVVAPPQALTAPAGFAEAWHAPSGATAVPVAVGNAVVTGDGSEVVGRDALTGAPAWSYRRTEPLCTVGEGFDSYGDDVARALAVYENGQGWCSEMTSLRPDTGTRAGARNPDLRPGTRLLSNSSVVAGTGDTIEVMRSDLVRTTEYGQLEAPAEPDLEPRPQCTHGTTALTSDRLGVIERCPEDATDRLTVLSTDQGPDGKPVVTFSVQLPTKGATLVGLSPQRAVVALPNPSRLLVLDTGGGDVATYPIDASAAELAAAANAPGDAPATSADQHLASWWTGSSTILLDPVQLTPLATVPGAVGPAVTYGDSTLIPVRAGLAVVDPAAQAGPVVRTIPVVRPDPTAPVQVATQGEVLLEQRGSVVTALVPSG